MLITRRTLLRYMSTGAAIAVASRARVARAAGPASVIRLDTNDSAYGPSPRAMAALRTAAAGQKADLHEAVLRRAIAAHHSVTPDRVVVGCGPGEILRMAADAFTGSGRNVIVSLPTVDVPGAAARRAGATVVEVPLRKDYAHDLDAMLARTGPDTGLVYVCNPNNPTGTLTGRHDLDAFLRRLPSTTYVLIDEGYHDYIGGSPEHASFIDRPADGGRVIVSRSFSTIHGLAGMRIGYAIAAPQTARLLAAKSVADEVGHLNGARAAIAAIEDVEHVRSCVRRTADDRQEFFNQANARMLRTIDSQTNFVMLNTQRPSVEVIEHFKRNNILVWGPIPAFDKHIRVSLGTAAAMKEFWRVWDLLPGGHKMAM
jgi:histidinol-phosphate aminotransferase